jgi:beta-galactosidase
MLARRGRPRWSAFAARRQRCGGRRYRAPLRLAGGSASTAEATLALPAAHLWQGVDDPYLYTLRAEIVTRGGSVADRLDQRYGIRQFTIDPEKGFFLNGRPYPLRGVGYHQDNEAHGWAIQPADVEADVRTLREMGANSIRLTHYQHGATIHDLADRLGLIVWDEIPLVSQWTLGGAKTASDGLRANARQQLAELIAQNRNHASVAVWSIANEVDFGNSLPMFLTGGSGTPPDPAPLLAELGTLAKRLDPSRPTALATCCEGRLFGAGVDVPITATAVDVAGANRYFGWYYGKAPEVSENLDALRQKRPAQPLAVTEYGAGGAISIHTDNVLGGPVDSRGRNQPEEILDYVHEQNWAVLSRKPYLWATWIWAGFDFASTVRQEGDAVDINTKGMIDYDHQTRKDVFYFYKANWSKQPTVYVTGRHYRDRAYASTDVRVYSNAPETTLFVNDVRIGTRADCPEHVCTWPGIALREGANVVRAVGQFGASSVADSLTWQLGADAARAYRIDSGTLVAGPSANGRHGSDAFFDGGEAGTVVEPADYGKPQKPVVIAGTPDSAIAATYREGAFHYRMPVGPGRYRVSLTFIEPSARPGSGVSTSWPMASRCCASSIWPPPGRAALLRWNAALRLM